jgi:hypothetical protein
MVSKLTYAMKESSERFNQLWLCKEKLMSMLAVVINLEERKKKNKEEAIPL